MYVHTDDFAGSPPGLVSTIPIKQDLKIWLYIIFQEYLNKMQVEISTSLKHVCTDLVSTYSDALAEKPSGCAACTYIGTGRFAVLYNRAAHILMR